MAERRYDIDWLRVLVVVLVLFHHAMLVFVADPVAIVYVKDPSSDSKIFTVLTMFNRQFQMELLFLFAGFAAFYSLRTRTAGVYVKERVLRLFVPYIAATITIVPVMTYFWPLSHGTAPSFWNHYLNFFSIDPANLDGLTGAYTPAHLWFVLYLFILSLISLPLFLILKNNIKNLLDKIADIFAFPGMLLLLALPLAAADFTNIFGSKNPLVFLLLMIYGFVMAGNNRYQKTIDRDLPLYLILAVIIQIFNNYLPYGQRDLIIYNAGRWCWMLSFFAIGHLLLNKNSGMLKNLSAASYPFYILHLPVLTVISYFIVPSAIYYTAKYFIIVVLTAAVTWGIYFLAGKNKAGRFLLGMK